MPKQISRGRKWYTVHTYAGYEDAVAKDLKRRIASTGMEDKIFNVIVPKEKKIKIRNGQRKIVEEKIYPGYVLVEMIVTDDSWYVVRNTPRVTGFVGSGVVPTPLSDAEINEIKRRMSVEEPKFKLNVSVGDLVKIVDGPFKNSLGKIGEIDEEHGRVKVLIPMFGRETPVDMDFLQIKKA